jgi:hypothetical protein
MILAEVIAEPARDDVTIYELPELGEPESVVLPVIHGFWGHKTYYSFSRFEEFGLPLYIVLTKDEKTDFDKIYDKIRRRYTQFASAEELQSSTTSVIIEETPADDAMEDVVLTRQDVNQSPNMVTLRVQPWHKSNWSVKNDVEMPTTVDKLEHLYDLRDFLRPPISARMQSVAPSAMESIHQDGLTPPGSIADESFVDAIEDHPGDDENASVGPTYFGQHGSFVEPLNEEESDTPMPSDDIDNTLQDSTDLHLSDSEDVHSMDNTDREASTPSMHDLSDNDSSDLLTPSQLGEEHPGGRGHAPSPDIPGLDDDNNLPPYSPFPTNTSGDDEIIQHELKFGDQLVHLPPSKPLVGKRTSTSRIVSMNSQRKNN